MPPTAPVHRRVQVELPGLHQVQGAHRRERLADRVELDQAVGLPRAAVPAVGVTTPQVDHRPAVAPRRERRTGARLPGQDTGEALTYRGKPGVGVTPNVYAAIMASAAGG
jgi:hypothetical protein